MILALGHRIDIVLVLVLSRRRFRPTHREGGPVRDRAVVLMLPCLNEERVIAGSLDSLLDRQHPRMHVIVVEDGSDDDTAAIVTAHPDPGVHLVRRSLPDGRRGKGEALNEALRFLAHGGALRLPVPADVVVAVVDADGRLDPHTLDSVLPFFDDPGIGGVQIGVRISNRRANLLAPMQDVEFILDNQVFQRGRRHLGSLGPGGNGQFVRLSALLSLGPAPWTRCLTEDPDLGVRLLLTGWQPEFTPPLDVHQQGLVDVQRWLRQRARWFQGHLQTWTLVPPVLRRLPGWTRADVFYHLTGSFLLLVASVLTAAFALWLLGIALSILGTVEPSWWWLSADLFAFGPAVVLGWVYRPEERMHGLSLPGAVLLMHAYVGYAVLWYIAGRRAVGRVILGRTGWTKTDRVVEPAPTDRLARAGSTR